MRGLNAVLNKMKKRLTWQWRRAGEDNSAEDVMVVVDVPATATTTTTATAARRSKQQQRLDQDNDPRLGPTT